MIHGRLLPPAALIALAVLSGCGALGDGGVAVQSVLGSFERPARAPEGACVWEGRLIVPAGVGADIRLCAPPDGPIAANTTPGVDADAPGGAQPDTDATTEPSTTPPADRVAAQLLEDEGWRGAPYALDGACHIGLGRRIDRADCAAIAAHRETARNLAGDAWAALNPARRDALTIFCYWAACAGYGAAWSALGRGDYAVAADEILDLDGRATLPRIDFTRAADLAETVRSGAWSFAEAQTPGRY